MKTTCRSCGAALWISDDSAPQRVRCRTCGTTNDLVGHSGVPSRPRKSELSARLIKLSRTEPTTAVMRTIILRVDGTTELRAGAESDDVVTIGTAPHGTVLAWMALRTAADAGELASIVTSDAPGCAYDLELGAAHFQWTGVPAGDSQLWPMLSALWSTLEQSPL